MKIRQGWVSNSSSSSFLLVSTYIDDLNEKSDKELRELLADDVYEKYVKNNDLYQCADDLGLTLCSENEYSGYSGYIGVDETFTDDSKTVGQIKKEAAAKISKFFKKNITPEDVGFNIIVDEQY